MGDLTAVEKFKQQCLIFIQHLATCIQNVDLSPAFDFLMVVYHIKKLNKKSIKKNCP